MGSYIERYVYDLVGNFSAMQHQRLDPLHPGWTRRFEYGEPSLLEPGAGAQPIVSNRLTSSGPEGGIAAYEYDTHGNVIRLEHLGGAPRAQNLHWDCRDHLRLADLGGGGRALYVYNASGERIRKVWEKSTTLIEERIYLNGFEIFRRHGGPIGPASTALERETLHVLDNRRRIAVVEMRTLDTAADDPAPDRLVRYQFGNHLDSASLELDGMASIVSYEEYSPYGSTTYQAVRSQTDVPKRYRFAGKERDEESGLYYFGGRYLAPWIGRWIQCDPAEFVDGSNLYAFVGGNPIRFSDPSGFGKDEQQLGARNEKMMKDHQKAANANRKAASMDPVDTETQLKGVSDASGKKVIPDQKNTTPQMGNQTVVEHKARNIVSATNQDAAKREADILANLEQVKGQLQALQKEGKIKPTTKGAALRVIFDNDKGASSTAAVEAWRKEANAVRDKWVNAAADPVEKAWRSRVVVGTTTADHITKATKTLKNPKGKRFGGKGGAILGAAIAAYILFETGDAWAAAQTFNPAANTTDLLDEKNITPYAIITAVGKDALGLAGGPGALTLLIWTLIQPTGGNIYSDELAKKAIAEGRNPFCAQCHGPGGALDPNNDWNQKNTRSSMMDFDDLDEEKARAYFE